MRNRRAILWPRKSNPNWKSSDLQNVHECSIINNSCVTLVWKTSCSCSSMIWNIHSFIDFRVTGGNVDPFEDIGWNYFVFVFVFELCDNTKKPRVYSNHSHARDLLTRSAHTYHQMRLTFADEHDKIRQQFHSLIPDGIACTIAQCEID